MFTADHTHGPRQPDKLMAEIPTLLVHQLSHGRCDECDHGFVVMNRPWGVVQLVQTEHWRSKIPEECVVAVGTVPVECGVAVGAVR